MDEETWKNLNDPHYGKYSTLDDANELFDRAAGRDSQGRIKDDFYKRRKKKNTKKKLPLSPEILK